MASQQVFPHTSPESQKSSTCQMIPQLSWYIVTERCITYVVALIENRNKKVGKLVRLMQTTSPAFTLMDTNICPFCSPQACVQTPKTTLVQVNKIVDADQTVNRTPERYAQTYAANNTIDQHGQNTLGQQCSMSQVIQNVQAHMLTNFMIPRSGNTHYVLSISLVLEYTAYHRNSHLTLNLLPEKCQPYFTSLLSTIQQAREQT